MSQHMDSDDSTDDSTDDSRDSDYYDMERDIRGERR